MSAKTITCTGYVVYDKFRAQYPNSFPSPFVFVSWKPEDSADQVLVREHSFDVEVPDDFDPRPAMVKALEAQKEQARADFAKLVTDLDRQINELLALEA